MIKTSSEANHHTNAMHKGSPPQLGKPRRRVIDDNAVRFLIGASAIVLPVIEMLLSYPLWLESISASYAASPWPRNLFVGFNFAIGAFMLTYNGEGKWESRLAKIGALASFVVALVPGLYNNGEFLIGYLPSSTHVTATLVLFFVLIGFCAIFRHRAERKLRADQNNRALQRRVTSYVVLGGGLIVSILLFAAHGVWAELLHNEDRWHLLVMGETLGLFSFALTWLMAAKFIFATPQERIHLWVKRREPSGGTDLDFLTSK